MAERGVPRYHSVVLRHLHSFVGALVLVASCARPGVVVAPDGSHRLVAIDRPTGVSVVLTTESWDGHPELLPQDLTIVHALVANMGSTPVLLAPGDLELHDDRGFRYELLDPGASFRLADDPNAGLRGYDPGRSDDFGVIRAENADVARAALPWGVLYPGTQMRGFLYFQKITDTANRAKLVWHMQAADHRPLADFAFELAVARP